MKRPVQTTHAAPFFGLVMFWFGMEYLRPQDYVAALGVIRPALMLLLVISLVWLMRGDKSVLKDNLVLGYLLFIGLGVVSLFFARNTYWVAQTNLILISFLFGGVLPFVAFINRPEALRRFFGWWVLLHALVAVGGILRGGVGSGSFMEDENDLALTMAMALPFAYFLAMQGRQSLLAKGLFLTAGLLMVAAIIVSRSRGGFLGLIMASLAIVWYSRNRARNFVAVAIIGAAFAIGVSRDYVDEMKSIQNARDATRLSRFYYWGRSWEMFVDNPVLGVGTGNFAWRVEDYEKSDPTFPGGRRLAGGRVAHSLYFTVLAEYGAAGTAVFIALGIGLWSRMQRARTRLARVTGDDADTVTALSRAASASLLAYLVSGAFLTVLYYPHFWYLLGFAIGMDRVAARLAPEAVKLPRFGAAQAQAARSRV